MLKQLNNRTTNQLVNVKQILDSHGFSYVFNDPLCINLKQFTCCLKNGSLMFLAVVEQRNNIEQLSVFVKIFQKLDILPISLEPFYHDYVFRPIILLLKLVVMTVTGLKDTNVLCLLCDKHDVEDEYHFVLKCPVYLHFRKRFIMSYFFRVPSVHKLIEFMQSPNKHTLIHLGKYVNETFALRNSLVSLYLF